MATSGGNFCKAELTTMLVRTAVSAMIKKPATLRNIRRLMDNCSAAGNGARANPMLLSDELRPTSRSRAGSRVGASSNLDEFFEVRGNGCIGGSRVKSDLARVIL